MAVFFPVSHSSDNLIYLADKFSRAILPIPATLTLTMLIILIILAAGLYPSVVISNFKPLKALKGIQQNINEGISVRKGLVVTQFSIRFVLIAVSILVLLQLDYLFNKDIGNSKEMILHVNIPNTKSNSLSTLKHQLLQQSFCC